MPITSIQTYDNVNNQYCVIVWHQSFKKTIKDKKLGVDIITQDNVNYIYCLNQNLVINTFFTLLKTKQIDCISGWYSGQYDLPYILNRCKKLDINPNSMTIGN